MIWKFSEILFTPFDEFHSDDLHVLLNTSIINKYRIYYFFKTQIQNKHVRPYYHSNDAVVLRQRHLLPTCFRAMAKYAFSN